MSEVNNITQDEQNRALFMQLVIMLATSAMQQMGKLMNPATGKAEVNLDAAEASIDFLDMLRVKTTGNLDKDEERVLADSLHSLRMNYWETRQTHGGAEQQAPANDQPAVETPKGATAEDAGAKPDETKEPKFHKRYE